MKVNLHTHTYRCGHAYGTDEEYVLAAIQNGYTKLGFSDHGPFPYEPQFQGKDPRMTVEIFEEYLTSITALKEKYKDQIEILIGVEEEAAPRFYPFLAEIRPRLDYMILGSHGDWTEKEYFGGIKTKEGLEHYVEKTVGGLETGLFLYLAHPDLMLQSYPGMDDAARYLSRQLCREANRLHIPLEYNFHGSLKKVEPPKLGYPCDAFWEIAAEENVRAVVGVDAHKPAEFEMCDMGNMTQKLRALGITVLPDPTQG